MRCFAKFRLFCRNRDFSLCIVLSFLALSFSHWTSLVAQLVKNPPAMRETWVRSLGWDDPLEKGKATHSSILAWTIPWTHGVTKSQTQLSDFYFHFTFSRGKKQTNQKQQQQQLDLLFWLLGQNWHQLHRAKSLLWIMDHSAAEKYGELIWVI